VKLFVTLALLIISIAIVIGSRDRERRANRLFLVALFYSSIILVYGILEFISMIQITVSAKEIFGFELTPNSFISLFNTFYYLILIIFQFYLYTLDKVQNWNRSV
jgi:hypothetical protein